MINSQKELSFNAKVVFIVSLMLLVTLTHSKVLNCRPLPQCCRRYVFSPACRGVAAKRDTPRISKSNIDGLIRDPRLFSAQFDSDYITEKEQKNIPSKLINEDIRSLSEILRNGAEDNLDYLAWEN